MNETNGFGLHLADPDGSARWKREADEQAARFAREREQEREQERQRNEQAEMRHADEQREAAERWDRHVRDLIQQQHDFQIEVVAGALAEMRKAIETETTKAIRIAVLEILPKVMEEREQSTKAIAELVDKVRDEIRAETRTNLRLMLLEQGFMPRVRGTWNENESYSALDIVMNDGACWIAKVSNPGTLPGENWQILSCKGERGKIGPIGPRGEQGERGDVGPQGSLVRQ
jgi:hypothetical protein